MQSKIKSKMSLAALAFGVVLAGGVISSVASSNMVGVHAAAGSDTITIEKLGITARSDTAFTYTGENSGVTYKGALYKYDGVMSFNKASNKSGGIYTAPANGEILQSLTITIGSQQNASYPENGLYLYGSDTPYTSISDLYDAEKRGEQIAELTLGDADANRVVSYTLTKAYSYVGLISNGYFFEVSSLQFDWAADSSGLLPSIVINPSIHNVEVGQSAIATATLTNAPEGTAVTWSSSDTSILTIDATTGEYTGVKWGDVTVTASITVNQQVYSHSVVIGVNDEAEIDDVLAFAADYEDNEISKCAVTVVGYVSEASTSSSKNTTITIHAQPGLTSETATGLQTHCKSDNADSEKFQALEIGDYIKVNGYISKYYGVVQLVYPWLLDLTAEEFAISANARLDEACATEDVTAEIWEGVEFFYTNMLSDEAKADVTKAKADPAGTELEQFASRYDFIAKKYEFANDFANRLGVVNSHGDINNGNDYILPLCIVIGLLTLAGIAIPVALKLRKRYSK